MNTISDKQTTASISDNNQQPTAPGIPVALPIGDAHVGMDSKTMPMASVVQMCTNSEADTYTGCAAGPHASYLVRSDGCLDRTTRNGEMTSILAPKAGTKYLEVSAGEYASYAVRDDGCVVRIKSATDTTEMLPPPSDKYVSVTSGEHASYLLLESGAVHRTTGRARIQRTLIPAEKGVRYTAVSAGTHASYLLRSDGSVDRTTYRGKIGLTMTPPPGTTYVAVAAGEFASYLVRSDGVIDRTKGYGKVDSHVSPPSDSTFKYVGVSDMFAVTTQHSQYSHKDSPRAMYFIRDDGAVDRTTGGGVVTQTMNPPPGLKYLAASSGLYASYLLQSDGKVARTTGGGMVSKQIRMQ